MARKFISFLGITNYIEMYYEYHQERTAEKTKFVQVALLELVCKNFDIRKDKVVILLTQAARNTNWEGLRNALMEKGIPEGMILPIDVEEERGEAGVWRLFEKLYKEALDDGDSVIFDITNAFRFLPVVMYSVLRYAQYLKNVKVEGIYYGNYDQRVEDVEPIINLTETYEIIEWATAANIFTSYGIADDLYKRIKKQDKDFSETGKLSDSILTVSRNINYSRGLRIMEGEIFQNCIEKINQYIKDEGINPALPPILETVTDKIKDFKDNSVLNFIPAVQWYIEHDMPAEALSMMKEGIVSYLLVEHGGNHKDSQLRLVLGKRLAFYEGKKKFNYQPSETKYEPVVEEIMQQERAQELKTVLEKFNQFRNDIDHCGFGQGARNPENLKKEIKAAYSKIRSVLCDGDMVVVQE
ncbi:MAG: TIGR02221 family CRISPR-associated protein [Spirochaetaceae bacterium]|nr:TIGR02221 family CRISPR-associated protein [Spirochaetaceae bacterium]